MKFWQVLGGGGGMGMGWDVNFNFPPRNNAPLESTGAGEWKGVK
jgi:hypothetical protein